MLSNLVDTKDRIARSNIYSIFGKLMNLKQEKKW